MRSFYIFETILPSKVYQIAKISSTTSTCVRPSIPKKKNRSDVIVRLNTLAHTWHHQKKKQKRNNNRVALVILQPTKQPNNQTTNQETIYWSRSTSEAADKYCQSPLSHA